MKKVLVANRGEIAIRVFRACTELGIKTVAIYAQEDDRSVHRFKADEAYLVGQGKKPIEAYLDIEGIIQIAKNSGADAIHPGYGFLSENIDFARRCEEEDLIFVGPRLTHLDQFGDKIKAKQAALAAGIQTIPGTDGPVRSLEEIYQFAEQNGYPIMIKAALGGGGRGMRIAQQKEDVAESYARAKSEAQQAFGSDEVYAEKYIANPKHIEVQIMGDQQGNVIHLFERDCSVQRRHQKVIEVAPCISLTEELRQKICAAALQLMQHVQYVNAGTVEFLVENEAYYFIEVNPRIQVEHTITEMITGIDLVQTQLQVAAGMNLFTEIKLPRQEKLRFHGAALQCRITTEDPLNNFLPDTGKIDTYRSPGGFGVRLDVGNAFAGAVITPYFDSLLVKACVHAYTFELAVQKMRRVLSEFRIRGVKTNIPFMQNVIENQVFLSGQANTTFIDQTPSLFIFPHVRNRGNKIMTYIGEITVNGFPGVERHEKKYLPEPKEIVIVPEPQILTAKQILDTQGADAVSKWVQAKDEVLLTDTTYRDAHQSLLATRMRSKDILGIAEQEAQGIPQLFSVEMWGGATFDVAYRFLNENPWKRLQQMREKMPNTLFQMLFRGSNAVGYQNYPDNVLEDFIKLAIKNGIDVFRIFDSLNWMPQMAKSIQVVRDQNKIAEATICYTGDILDPNRQKYNLAYYRDLAVELENQGAHLIAIKDMAGLLKPEAAYNLISTLKAKLTVPLHLHTHDTTGNAIATYSRAIDAGVDIVDVAMSSLSGTTSQPSMSSLYYARRADERRPQLNIKNIEAINRYWAGVRPFYSDFENGITTPQTEIYQTEMPGGQYSNLLQQAKAVGLGDDFGKVKDMYAVVNQMFGDIIKVTPSSKVVGDMTLFMLKNQLTPEIIMSEKENIDFPDSVVQFFMGNLGQPVGGFPEKLQKIILKGKTPLTERPGLLADPVDFGAKKSELQEITGYEPADEAVMSYIIYPQVYLDYNQSHQKFGDIALLDTVTFFQGMREGETIEIQIEKGKTLILQLDQIGAPDDQGQRTLYFNLNGQRREIVVLDTSINLDALTVRKKAEPTNKNQLGATMSGSVLSILVERGQRVSANQALIVTEAMKMETTIQAPFDGIVRHIYLNEGDTIETGDLLVELEKC